MSNAVLGKKACPELVEWDHLQMGKLLFDRAVQAREMGIKHSALI